jgi:NH3-dependent NAD+ synthetase
VAQVVQLAEFLGVPDEIVKEPPSFDMLNGAGNEILFAFSYQTLDNVAYAAEHGWGKEAAVNHGVRDDDVETIHALPEASEARRTTRHEFPSLD